MESMTKLFKEHLVGTWKRHIASDVKEKFPVRHTQEEIRNLQFDRDCPMSNYCGLACVRQFTYLDDDVQIECGADDRGRTIVWEDNGEGGSPAYSMTVVGSGSGECTLVAYIDLPGDTPEVAFCRMSFSDDWSYLLLEDVDGNGRLTYDRVEENE